MSSPKPPKTPAPTASELEAQRQQNILLAKYGQTLEEQGAEAKLLQPILYEYFGLEPTYETLPARISGAELRPMLSPNQKSLVDLNSMYSLEDALSMTGDQEAVADKIRKKFESIQPTTQLTGLKKRAKTEAETKREEIENLSLERERAALKGELPVNPGLLSDLDYQQRQLENTLAKQLGPGWQTSSPAIEAMEQFARMKNTVLENARRGDLTLADALQSNAMAQRQAAAGQFFNLGAGTSQLPFSNVSGYGQAASAYGNLATMLAQQRLAQYGTELSRFGMSGGQNTQNTMAGVMQGGLSGASAGAYFGPWGAAIGGLVGAAAGGLSGRSSREFKENIEEANTQEILDYLESTPVYYWNYKPGLGEDSKRRHIGPIVEEAPAIIVDGKLLVTLDYMGFLLGAIKGLAEKVKALEAHHA